MLTIKAHFDGKVFVPDEPLDLELNQTVELEVRPVLPTRRSVREMVGWALKYPPNPNPRPALTDDELWETKNQ